MQSKSSFDHWFCIALQFLASDSQKDQILTKTQTNAKNLGTRIEGIADEWEAGGGARAGTRWSRRRREQRRWRSRRAQASRPSSLSPPTPSSDYSSDRHPPPPYPSPHPSPRSKTEFPQRHLLPLPSKREGKKARRLFLHHVLRFELTSLRSRSLLRCFGFRQWREGVAQERRAEVARH